MGTRISSATEDAGPTDRERFGDSLFARLSEVSLDSVRSVRDLREREVE